MSILNPALTTGGRHHVLMPSSRRALSEWLWGWLTRTPWCEDGGSAACGAQGLPLILARCAKNASDSTRILLASFAWDDHLSS